MKKLAVLAILSVLFTGVVMAEEMAAPMAEGTEMAAAEPAQAIEVGNAICPLTGRTLNLQDPNDFTTLEAEGFKFNVCPKAKAEYDQDAAKYSEQIAKAVAVAKGGEVVDAAAPMADQQM